VGGGEGTKRIIAIAVVCIAVMVFTFAKPVAASNRYWATGADVQINMIDHCGEDFTYPANTPFFIAHGWFTTEWTTNTPALDKRGFMAPTTYFEFRVDRVPQPSSMNAQYFPETDIKVKLFVSEFDQGMTGPHRLGALWFLDGSLVGGTFGEAMFQGACVSNVNFA